jgi:regulator of protease activity HflC (stomatin/prohibitin superfamily)
MPIADLLISHPVLTAIGAAPLISLLRSIRIANQYERAVVFRLGKFNRTAGPGLLSCGCS